VFVAVLVFALQHRSKPVAKSSSPPSTAASRSQTSDPATTKAPATTAAPSPTDTLANDLRAAAAKLGPSDGARAADLAAMLRQAADQVQAGGGGAAATGDIVSIGAWRLTGQISDAAATSAINLLSRVPGATVVTLPSVPLLNGGASAPAPTAPATPAPAPANGNGKGKGKKD
jgi:hypothetical protein